MLQSCAPFLSINNFYKQSDFWLNKMLPFAASRQVMGRRHTRMILRMEGFIASGYFYRLLAHQSSCVGAIFLATEYGAVPECLVLGAHVFYVNRYKDSVGQWLARV